LLMVTKNSYDDRSNKIRSETTTWGFIIMTLCKRPSFFGYLIFEVRRSLKTKRPKGIHRETWSYDNLANLIHYRRWGKHEYEKDRRYFYNEKNQLVKVVDKGLLARITILKYNSKGDLIEDTVYHSPNRPLSTTAYRYFKDSIITEEIIYNQKGEGALAYRSVYEQFDEERNWLRSLVTRYGEHWAAHRREITYYHK
ncbi:MAG TPA: hypothetical protein VEV15_08735, partial [Flavisolibacter sp.]|nr:hypothetical protein [Flavisolibacter sp.]